MSECVFCRIIAGNEPASVLHRDGLCIAFMDVQPVNPGHLLVVPIRHATHLADLDPETGAHIFQVGQRLAGGLRSSGLRCEGVNLFVADGAAAGQDVFHVHLHVIPRFVGDGFGFTFAPGYHQRPPRSELEANAAAISAALSSATGSR